MNNDADELIEWTRSQGVIDYRNPQQIASDLTRSEAAERTILRRRIMKDYGVEAYNRSIGLEAEGLREFEQQLRDRAVEIAKEREIASANPRWGQF